jgi:hypothetical protein
MIKIIYLILCLILGILLYQILKNYCECNIEGFGLFSRAKLGKCCPIDYMYSQTDKKCVKICDGCTMGAYSPMKLKMEKYYGDSQPQLHAYFDCKENDASEVYNYDKINRLYKKTDLIDQYDYGFNLDSEMMSGSGVQAAEEGGNEAWAGISGDAASGHSGVWHETSSAQDPFFKEIPEEYYYTKERECVPDYNNYSIKFPNAGNPPNVDGLYYGKEINEGDSVDCHGHWRLDMTDERFDYVKDNDELFAIPSWIVYTSKNAYKQSFGRTPVDPEYSVNKEDNLLMIQNTINDIGNENSPVYKFYEEKLYSELACVPPAVTNYGCIGGMREPEVDISESLNVNRVNFCKRLETHANPKTTSLINETTSLINEINYNNLCIDSNMEDSWKSLCAVMNKDIINDEWNIDSDENSDENPDEKTNILCTYEQDNSLCSIDNENMIKDTSKTFC